jgi:uncharacterized protein (TIGR03435 family)
MRPIAASKNQPTECLLARITGPSGAKNFLRKSLLLTAVLIVSANPILLAQNIPATNAASAPAPSFEVATIKPHPGQAYSRGLIYQPDGFTGTVTLPMLIQNAYSLLTEDRVIGAPDWAKNEWFDIQVKIGAEDIAGMQKLSTAESNARRALMMQAFLAERFKLKEHSAITQVPVYELVLAKGSSKLVDSATDTNPKLNKGKDSMPRMGIRSAKDTSFVEAYSMSAWALFLSQPMTGVGRPVLDKTGLPGAYDFDFNWSVYSARPAMPGAVAGDASAPDDTTSIFGALKEVGLKLQPATGPIDTIVIDHVEKPSAN